MDDASSDGALDVDPDSRADEALCRPGGRAHCIHCGELLIAKCGEINRWHWAHELGNRTCAGSGLESAWHTAWKLHATKLGATTELTVGSHRADIVWPDGSVYELQSRWLDVRHIAQREQQYGDRLTWVYRTTRAHWGRLRNDGDCWFRFVRPPLSITHHARPVIWHHGDRLYRLAAIVIDDNGHVRVKFTPGETDQYGPVAYGSEPAPFAVSDALAAVDRLAAA